MTKNILITGASGDIGRAIAAKLSSHNLGLHYNSDRSTIPSGDNIRAYQEDFTYPQQTLAKRFLDDFGTIDALVNCAGVTINKPFFDIDAEEFDRVFAVNARAHYLISRDVFLAMKERGGRIVNISSIATTYGVGRNETIHYAGSKAALDTLTIGLARLGAPYNILANSISPGAIDSRLQNGEFWKLKRIPLGRFGKTEEIADMVDFLISDKGSFITGQNIRIAGGE